MRTDAYFAVQSPVCAFPGFRYKFCFAHIHIKKSNIRIFAYCNKHCIELVVSVANWLGGDFGDCIAPGVIGLCSQ